MRVLKKSKLRVDPGAECVARVMVIKPTLPRNYRQVLFQEYPEYNTVEGIQLLNNVISGRVSDLKLTGILERIEKRELMLRAA